MALGAVAVVAGLALFYESWTLAVIAALFFVAVHLFVVLYEEPTLRRTFSDDYEAYRSEVRRWWPRLRRYRG